MSFDKLQAMRNAERFLSQGKLRAAVNEYAQIVQHDSKDFNTLNMLGDLYVKIEEKEEAVTCFYRVAEHYGKQGFAQKAIAIYNKISRLTPNSYEVSIKLAPLYHLKGSVVEARNHYNIVAEFYQKNGKRLEALNILKKIAELDPNNTEIYLKLAEGYWQEGHTDEAHAAYNEAGARLLNKKQYESSATAFSRALELKTEEIVSLKGFVTAQSALGYADEALELLERKCAENPYNIELLSLLIDTYLEIDKPAEAETAVINLVAKEPSNYKRFLEVIEKYLKFNNIDSSVRLLQMASEHLLVGGQAEELKKWIDEILTRNPEQIDTLRLLIRYCAWMRDEKELRIALDRLAESGRLNDSIEDERYALTQLVAIIPHERKYAERLEEIGGASIAEDFSIETNEFAQAETFGEVPKFESFENLANDNESATGDFSSDQNAQNNFSNEDSFQNESEESANSAGNDFGFSETTLNGNHSSHEEEEDEDSGKLSPSLEMHLHQELESVDFYISSEYNDLAIDTLKVLENQFGNHPEIKSRKAKLGILEEDKVNVSTVSNVEAESNSEMSFADLMNSTENNSHSDFSDSKNNDFSDFEVSTFNGNSSAEQKTETNHYSENGYSTNKVESKSEGFSDFDDFRNELGLEESEDSYSGDFETHYNLGIAYKEMGLMEDAVKEFQDAAKLVKPNDANRNHFQCCNWLGHCFMEKQMPNLALKWFEKCLETHGLTEEEQQALRYEIALAYSADDNKEKAIQYFEEIYSNDVEYRDVSQKLQELKSN